MYDKIPKLLPQSFFVFRTKGLVDMIISLKMSIWIHVLELIWYSLERVGITTSPQLSHMCTSVSCLPVCYTCFLAPGTWTCLWWVDCFILFWIGNIWEVYMWISSSSFVLQSCCLTSNSMKTKINFKVILLFDHMLKIDNTTVIVVW